MCSEDFNNVQRSMAGAPGRGRGGMLVCKAQNSSVFSKSHTLDADAWLLISYGMWFAMRMMVYW